MRISDRASTCLTRTKARQLIAMAAAFLIAATCDLAPAAADQFNFQRGYENYRRILAGEIHFQDLSEIERQEVMFISRALESSAPDHASPECKDAYDDADDASEQLVSTAQRLIRCAENNEFDSDDCSSEMRRTRSAHSEYESAYRKFRGTVTEAHLSNQRFALRQPAARASSSEQKMRSPLDVVITVSS